MTEYNFVKGKRIQQHMVMKLDDEFQFHSFSSVMIEIFTLSV